MQNLRELPKFRDSWSYLYVEHCKIEQEGKAIALYDESGKTPVPCALLNLLMLGPGTSISHAAIKSIVDCGCQITWTGEEGVRFYAHGIGENRSSERLIQQALMCSNTDMRLKVVRKMYEMRFPEPLPADLTLQQIRGREGIRVKEAYAKASEETGVEWNGRSYNRQDWVASDPINRALSSANACLYGICHSAIVSLGLSPGLGFIHTGKQLSFVYDIADLYKADITIPLAFSVVSSNVGNIESELRKRLRELFRQTRFMEKIVRDIDDILKLSDADPTAENEYDTDFALPGRLWDPSSIDIVGGLNYGDELA